MPDNFALLGISRTELSDGAFREQLFLKNEFIELNGETAETKRGSQAQAASIAIATAFPPPRQRLAMPRFLPVRRRA